MELNRKQFSLDYAGRPLTLEVSRIAEQASASVIGKYGDTTVLATVVLGKKDKDIGWLPLTVDYEERFYAVGKVLGSRFVRREGKSSEEAVLSGRVIDRTIRPLFDHRMRRDVQVVITILSLDEEEDLDFLALTTASTALAISEVPWNGPVAGVKIVRKDGQVLINPLNSQVGETFEYQSFVAGTLDRINMVELEGIDADEQNVVAGFELAQKEINKLIEFQAKIVKEIGKPKAQVKLASEDERLKELVTKTVKAKLEEAIYIKNRMERDEELAKISELLDAVLAEKEIDAAGKAAASHMLESLTDEIVHENIIKSNKRPDGRKLDELRDLHAEVALLKRTHGSALFIRGNTQSLSVATIAPPGQEQLIETMSFSGKRRFLLHYNFPAYSVGETGPFRGPGRREIGHGALAEKALRNLIPSKESFPYTIRLVSEILSSNGSSSMATVCAGSLALMDAGVPIKKPAAGIAMGLMSNDKGEYKVLTDIQGYEDHYGDMDFKAAGTADGVTAIQMDVKISGVTPKILGETLAQAKKARLEILSVITKALPAPRPEISPLARPLNSHQPS